MHRIINAAPRVDQIRLNTGSMRRRETWDELGISMVRDDDVIIYLAILSTLAVVEVTGVPLPLAERDISRLFPSAEKDFGHHYIIRHRSWRLDLHYALAPKRRGFGSSVRKLDRVYLAPSGQPFAAR